ncbi:MAG: YcgN family cysteine cluster protein [Acidiferrobacterales bacterium]
MKNSFWESKSLHNLDTAEWESLCDGCGICCLVKLEDSDSGEIHYTNMTCRLFNSRTCRCTDYSHRAQKVPTCFVLTPATINDYPYLPPTCAYRRLAEGKELPAWHPLLTGDTDSVSRAGIAVTGKVISELHVHQDDWPAHIVDWPLENIENSEK